MARVPTDEHIAKARELCDKVQAERYTVPTHNQTLGGEVGDLIKRMTDQGFFPVDRGRQAAKKVGDVSVQFLPKERWCKGTSDRGSPPCMEFLLS